ncbi:MAG TPA: aminoacetone oxidase family FAD-binding enzyme [Gemmatimonadales bacterium]|nr:aminoacetone oxidase family FAD-binding enzyme [Gemmatimonadales bacterium]
MSSVQLPIVVVGAGAAGLMAAIFAAEGGEPVMVLEGKEDGGRKILISGGGRCNVLPSELAPARFHSESAPHLVRRLLQAWPLTGQRRFFEEELGLALALEPETGKLFPVSNKARDVRDRLIDAARKRGVQFRFNQKVRDLVPSEGTWEITVDGAPVRARCVILATGGLSVPATGSDGAGLAIARRLGHQVRDTYPALTPLTADPPVHAALSGLSLTVTISAKVAGKKVSTTGGMLFTHRGYSGPAVLDISHVAVRSKLAGTRAELLVNWTGRKAEEWDQRLQERSARAVSSVVREQLPARLADRLLEECGVSLTCQLAQLPRAQRRGLIERLTAYPLPWTGDEGYKKAEVTGGGVALEEVHPDTLESRRHPGLYFCGEILDAFGPIGGYNFAWAWATGRTAGLGAQKKKAGPKARLS